MSTIKELHRRAMTLTDEAFEAQRAGNPDTAKALFVQAMKHELAAAKLVPEGLDAEPIRSVLYRSAATLALDSGDLREAERLTALGLSGDPPAEIAEELRSLMERVQFQRHLDLRGIVLETGDIQVTLAGAAVAPGFARSEEFIRRIEYTSHLIRRTYERQMGRPFQERGRPSRSVRQSSEVYLSIPRAASFAVTLRVGHSGSQGALDFPEHRPEVVPELMTCLEMANEPDTRALERRIGDPAYFQNFVGLFRQIAPDGKEITLVGFTARESNRDFPNRVTRTADEMPRPMVMPENGIARTEVEVTGQFRYADYTRIISNQIGLVKESGRTEKIVVPEGYGDIVHTLWEETVTVTGYREGGRLILTNIRAASTEPTLFTPPVLPVR